MIRLLSDLETEGRMARLLVEVRHPLGDDPAAEAHPPLILGEYVRVAIQGRALDNVYRIPRSALRDNARIWIARDDETLQIREVTPLWRDADYVLLQDGLAPGERLILSDLTAAVDGMAVRERTDVQAQPAAPDRKGATATTQ